MNRDNCPVCDEPWRVSGEVQSGKFNVFFADDDASHEELVAGQDIEGAASVATANNSVCFDVKDYRQTPTVVKYYIH